MAPNQPKTPISNFRIPVDLKERVVAKAEREGKTLTDVVLEQLRAYADDDQGEQK